VGASYRLLFMIHCPFATSPAVWYFFPLGIGAPGDCRSYFQASILTGSVQLTQAQVDLFSAPDFPVSSSPMGLYGRTDLNVVGIPEPASPMLAAMVELALLRRGGQRRAKDQGHHRAQPR
jgi:hypothetical protein